MSVLILSDEHHQAVKRHWCGVCGGVIAPGDRYRRQRGIFEGEPYTAKAHALCDAAHRQARRDLDLMPDESPEPEEAMPYVEAFFFNLTTPLTGSSSPTSGEEK